MGVGTFLTVAVLVFCLAPPAILYFISRRKKKSLAVSAPAKTESNKIAPELFPKETLDFLESLSGEEIDIQKRPIAVDVSMLSAPAGWMRFASSQNGCYEGLYIPEKSGDSGPLVVSGNSSTWKLYPGNSSLQDKLRSKAMNLKWSIDEDGRGRPELQIIKSRVQCPPAPPRPRSKREYFEALLQADPDSPVHHTGLGDAFASEGNPAEAESHYRRALERFPGYTAARIALAELLFDTGRQAESHSEYLRVLESRMTFGGYVHYGDGKLPGPSRRFPHHHALTRARELRTQVPVPEDKALRIIHNGLDKLVFTEDGGGEPGPLEELAWRLAKAGCHYEAAAVHDNAAFLKLAKDPAAFDQKQHYSEQIPIYAAAGDTARVKWLEAAIREIDAQGKGPR